MSDIGKLATLLGYKAPEPDSDPFWFREDHGPVWAEDLMPFLLAEVAAVVAERDALRKAADRLLRAGDNSNCDSVVCDAMRKTLSQEPQA